VPPQPWVRDRVADLARQIEAGLQAPANAGFSMQAALDSIQGDFTALAASLSPAAPESQPKPEAIDPRQMNGTLNALEARCHAAT
jgi:hypothetical protein